jgi:hypothetical protein
MSGNLMLISNTRFVSFFLVFKIIKVATVLQNYFLHLSEILRCRYDSVCDVYNEASVCLRTWLNFLPEPFFSLYLPYIHFLISHWS